jgi:hypothetical protein
VAGFGAFGCGKTDVGPGSARRQSSGAPASGVTAAVSSGPGSSAQRSALDSDRDNDHPGRFRYDPDNDAVPTYGQAASVADMQAIAALLERYYTLAAAGDGSGACSLVYWLFAETVVEEHRGRGGRSLRGNTCAQIASKLFEQRHRELIEDAATLHVAWVRVRGNRGVVLVRFGPIRERDVVVHRDRGVWKMNTLLDSGDP